MTRKQYDAIREMLAAYVALERTWKEPLTKEQARLFDAYEDLSDIAGQVAEINLVDDEERIER